MSITDELREYALRFVGGSVCAKLDAIADRIDVNHISEVGQTRSKAWNEGFDEGFASADDLSTASEETMAKHGWIRLPKDANGEYIHIGDVMAYADDTKPMQVVALVPPSVFMVEDGPRYADMCRHYHAPTVEDELTDLCERVWESALLGGTWSDSPVESYIAEYAAKLQLKDDAE